MKLRNKKTGELCELGHIRQAWREEKDGGMGYMFLKADNNNGIIYNSLAEMMDEWEDYKPKEPLIKDEKIRKAVRAWANSFDDVDEIRASDDYKEFWIDDYLIEFERSLNELESEHTYRRTNITELCGEEEE